MTKQFLRIHPADNVAIALPPEGISKGADFAAIRAREFIPQAHKIVTAPIAAGQSVVRYGQVIGLANRELPPGTHAREECIDLPAPPRLDDLALATEVPGPLPPLEGYTFDGYPNPDGSVGTRNVLAISTTVQCVAPVVDYAIKRIKSEVLPRFPNVDDVVALTHTYGCGVAIDAPGASIPIRTLRNISLHANAGAWPLVVSLGCEKLQPDRLFGTNSPQTDSLRLLQSDNIVRLQSETGFAATVSAIMEAAEKRLTHLNERRRQVCPASELVVGVQCGGSDAFSGITCNPAVGYAADLFVRAGATVLFSEVTEVRDAIHLLTPRALTPDVGRDLIHEMRWYDEYLARGGVDRSANPSPGNKRGGLANVLEKALGSIVKAGSTAIRAVATHGEKASTRGLVFAATPASDFICGTQQLASMNLHIFTTGEGSPYGLALVPVIKVSSRTSLANRWPDLIDLDAGGIATGASTVEEVGWELFRLSL
ncbi:MAG: galactarate dehydratase, partial [Bryobacterales bacterium]|nr:galactarate dehydratase [Bryobacterales bacterium]